MRAEAQLAARVADWPAAWIEAFEERAAIMEFDGGLARTDAERAAEQSTRREAQSTGVLGLQGDVAGARTRQIPRGGGGT